MALALTEEYINSFLRDQRTWRRACVQRCAAEEGPTVPAVGLYRRGSVTNVSTLHFAGALRGGDRRVRPLHSGELPREKSSWCSSTKPAAAGRDPLRTELRRNLRRRGYVDARENALRVAAARARSASPRTQRADVTLPKRRVTQVEEEECAGRRGLMHRERLLRERHARDVRLVRLNALLDDEFERRRSVFREWLASLLSLRRAEQSTFEHLTGVSPPQYRLLLNVQREQERQRQQLYREYDREAERFSKMILLLNLEAIEIEIDRCRSKEVHLRRMTARPAAP